MKKTNPNIIPENLKFLRKKVLGVSQEKFGEYIGITRNIVNQQERGFLPRTKFFIQIHDKWNINTHELLNTKMNFTNLDQFRANKTFPFGKEIQRAIDKLNLSKSKQI